MIKESNEMEKEMSRRREMVHEQHEGISKIVADV